jgi:capsular polysaccharide biosynthesis protein
LAQSPPRRCPAIQEGFFIDGLGRCFSVRDVLLSRLRDILSLSPHGPTDIWPTSKAYFEHFATRKPLREGLRYSEWASACENARKPAKAFHKKHPFFDPESPYLRGQYPDTFVISIPEGRIAGGKGAVITHDLKLLGDVSIDWSASPRDARRHPLLTKKKLPTAQRLPGISTVLATSESAGFFHWMTDALPRLEILRRASATGWDTIDHFLIGEGCHAIRESLRLLGIKESKLVVTRRDSHFVCDLLVVPSFHGAPGNMPPWAIEFLREQFLGSSSLPKSRRRIYVSRANASGRKIANEEEILPILTSRGFVCSELEEMSLSAQIELFSKAEAVVAPHGAGLTNLVWCAPHTKVLEIFSPLYVNFCYWAIASVTQADYYYLLGNAEGVVNDVYDARYFLEDILVDPIALQKTLSDMTL